MTAEGLQGIVGSGRVGVDYRQAEAPSGLNAGLEIKAAIEDGRIRDYRDAHYSNYKTLSEESNAALICRTHTTPLYVGEWRREDGKWRLEGGALDELIALVEAQRSREMVDRLRRLTGGEGAI